MWVLLISLYLMEPLGHVQSKGILHVPQSSYEQCQKTRDTVAQRLQVDGYRTAARCIWIKHYSEQGGAYSKP